MKRAPENMRLGEMSAHLRLLATVLGALVASLLACGNASALCLQQPAPNPIASDADLPIGISGLVASDLALPTLGALRAPSGAPLRVHFYIGYEGSGQAQVLSAIRAYARAGDAVLLTIRAQIAQDAPTPATYDAFVTQVLEAVAPDLSAVEITNEGNLPAPPSTSDGLTPDIIQDLISGVVTAKSYIRAHGLATKVGFNYVFAGHAPTDDVFWTRLKAEATPQFLNDVDFVGVHTYPNTASAPTPVDDSINAAEIDGLQTARCYMTYLGLAARVPIDVTEVGYPAPNSSYYAAQADYWGRVLDVIHTYRANENIAAVYVFTFRNTASSNIPFDFGIVNADGSPRPAYGVIEQRIAAYDPAHIAPAPGRTILPRCTITRLRKHSKHALLISAHVRGRDLVVRVVHAAWLAVVVDGHRWRSLRVRVCHTYVLRLPRTARGVVLLARDGSVSERIALRRTAH